MGCELPSTPPPLAPPKTWDATIAWLRLIRSYRVGPSTFFRLMAEHGSAEAALEALPTIAAKAGVSKYHPCSLDQAQREFQEGHALGATLLCYGEPDYPKQLVDLSDPPPILWALGDVSLTGRPILSLVGARNASSLGTRMARALAGELGQSGYVIASGLARGIDTAAHLAALKSGTIAVQAGGIDVIYPRENTSLHDQIAKQGLRLSEQPIGLQPMARHFPRRNRIISGLSRAVVVVEAAAKSGSLITAREALDQGRDVLAVPGHPFDARAAGCNMLIRDGACLIRSAQDVIEHIDRAAPPQSPAPALSSKPQCNPPPDRQILDLLSPTPMAEDQLIRDLNAPAAQVTPQLIRLELQGKIRRDAGGLLSLAG